MNEQYTPGPWRTKTMQDGSRNVIADHDFICQFSNVGGTERDKQEANGRLIAAAPDLLAALKEADEDFAREGFDKDGPYRAHIIAAIAKATGGTK